MQNSAKAALAVLVAINILNFYDRNVAGALVEPIRKEFHLSDTQIGFLGSVFIWLYAVVGVPLGSIADRWSRKKLLGGGMAIWGALTALAAVVTTFGGLMVSRLGVRAGLVAGSGIDKLGDALEQHVPPSDQSHQDSVDRFALPHDHPLHLPIVNELLEPLKSTPARRTRNGLDRRDDRAGRIAGPRGGP